MFRSLPHVLALPSATNSRKLKARLLHCSPVSTLPVTPSREEFHALCDEGNLIPVSLEVLADLETPVSAFLKLRQARPYEPAWLLESVEGGENLGRYSFLGVGSRGQLKVRGRQVTLAFDGESRNFELAPGRDPLHVVEDVMSQFEFVDDLNLPRFCGGAVGFPGLGFGALL